MKPLTAYAEYLIRKIFLDCIMYYPELESWMHCWQTLDNFFILPSKLQTFLLVFFFVCFCLFVFLKDIGSHWCPISSNITHLRSDGQREVCLGSQDRLDGFGHSLRDFGLAHDKRRCLLLRLNICHRFNLDFLQFLRYFLLVLFHFQLVDVVEDSCTQSVTLHVHHGGGAIPEHKEEETYIILKAFSVELQIGLPQEIFLDDKLTQKLLY